MIFGKGKTLPSYTRRRRKKVGSRVLVFLVFFILAAFFGYRHFFGSALKKANDALAAGDYAQSEVHFKKVIKLPFSKGIGRDGLGALALLQGQNDVAASHFQALLQQRPSRFGGDPELILAGFVDKGLYNEGKIYAEFLQQWKGDDQLTHLSVDLAAVYLGARSMDKAQAYLAKVPDQIKNKPRFKNLSQLAKSYELSGKIPVLLDRNGAPVLNYNLKTEQYSFVSSRLFGGWESDSIQAAFASAFGESDRFNKIYTSLDLNLQRAASQAMQGYKGTMILSNPQTGEILAAYGTRDYNPFTAAFEPGSVIKILTYGFFLQDGGDPKPYAPKNYPGNVQIGGKIFYDWTTQGQLNSIDEGMAVSCNLMFAQMGLDLSWPRLKKGLSRLYDGQTKPGFWGEAAFGEIIREPENAWDVGRIAIGLDLISTTSLGLSLIPNMVANNGTLLRPRLLTRFTNIEGTVYREVDAESLGHFLSEVVAEKVTDSMVQAVEFKKGTARRARVPIVKAAMKTGTAGDRPFDSIMVGLLPLPNPKLSFAFYLDEGGKCEINGAKVALLLQEQILALAPEYLEN